MSNILVSIHCITFNHEEYITEAIEGFLKQKTNFKYEILIHDDASTDSTADIIRKYEKLYPDLIKPIYQTENQHSKGLSVIDINISRAKGKYIALCEGDDYWIDPYKLQKQIDFMENHPECSLCVHGGYIEDNTTNKKNKTKHLSSKKNKYFTVEKVIEGGGGLFLTNSMLYRRKFEKIKPEFFKLAAPVGDYPLAINLSLLGSVYYMAECMSVYRMGVRDSWTAKNFSTITNQIEHYSKISAMLDEVNHYTDNRFEGAINRKKKLDYLNLLLAQGKFKEVKLNENKEYYLALEYKIRFIIFMEQYCPILLQFLRLAKRRWLNWVIK